MKNTIVTFREAKGQEKLVMLTAYDYSTARVMDMAGVDALLVGDSLGMVMLGYPDTLSVTVDDMVRHCAAVARGAQKALVVCDMPFMSYHVSVEETVRNAGRLMTEGRAQAVKLEGGAEFAAEVRALTRASIPVMGHLGLTPQSVNAFGGFKVQGKSMAAAQKLLDDARALQEAGAFALVLECVPAPLAERVTQALSIPVIGIGAGAGCDGQVLVWQDMTGMTLSHLPRFVKRFGEVGASLRSAVEAYAREVRAGAFPGEDHGYPLPEGMEKTLKKLK
ncbi:MULTISPECIES: 3-methyl-2-oxobutanoate hydroxymethyltransferase [Desulfovibrio]|uniref:3-methyl-2-oxobutanoate hydroxymethyltransferase n=2 Tax=root TaxID=1 RepID=A0A212JXH2_9BACT|nr:MULTISPECIES: 3-methyl-2-oxobutanoate hydroxymethyltransferase [Desulfovibrio]MBT9749928.1 3-methyl-2-oxobutanoate hydroxymethyltransferase [Desulfovibrio desulfuricans]MCB6542515.1 3-methyl-2-oxobutanoate hydroxymethyltransferase [Desulfovibrio desulfuricans]MCB6553477.1 3-methyl-2-oxobutanoate hydroxymethyltransferase [Desulfovibrio desulfuricans]MCB6565553.1 3-methyl-2-oxobutanoate hydroxymethyltransferase [Desulfovibrio desulfuricans]MCB7346520.1 3-methyl-2-oxobutanoate hydroxymethyltra